MADAAASFTIKTNGQRLVATVTPGAYTTSALTSAATYPAVLDSDTTYWVANPTNVAISVKTSDGTEIYNNSLTVAQGSNTTIEPRPTTTQRDATSSKLVNTLSGWYYSGNYYWTVPVAATSTSTSQTTGNVRLSPWVVPHQITITRIGAEIGTVGDAGSKLRLGIYADTNGRPGTLVLDAGTINGDSATVQEITVNQVLTPGVYWVGGCVQAVTTTSPAIRITSSTTKPNVIIPGATIPTAGDQPTGILAASSVTGALPATVTGTTTLQNAPRVFVKVG